jgi:hypothetical protein
VLAAELEKAADAAEPVWQAMAVKIRWWDSYQSSPVWFLFFLAATQDTGTARESALILTTSLLAAAIYGMRDLTWVKLTFLVSQITRQFGGPDYMAIY